MCPNLKKSPVHEAEARGRLERLHTATNLETCDPFDLTATGWVGVSLNALECNDNRAHHDAPHRHPKKRLSLSPSRNCLSFTLLLIILSGLHFSGYRCPRWGCSKTVDRLQKAGCKATALDLVSAGNDSTDPNSITTWAEYSKPAVDFCASLPADEKVVLIGHSMGGFTNLELMESFPQKIALAIFVSAPVTPSGVAFHDSPLADLMFKDTLLGEAATFTFANGADKPPTSLLISENHVSEVFYNGCSSEDIEGASALVKWFPVQTLGDSVTYTKERHGQVPAVFVKNLRDNTTVPRAQDFVVEKYGPFNEVVEVDAGHFSAWSHADEFVALVLLLADKYNVLC